MKDGAVVVPRLGVGDEVLDGNGSLLGKKFEDDLAQGGVDLDKGDWMRSSIFLS